MSEKEVVKVLFVCLGNICRSPVAEGVFKELVIKSHSLKKSYLCDSAGTSAYHIGEQPDKRMREVAAQNGVVLEHAGQQFTKEDFLDFDYIIAMDRSNYDNILSLGQPKKGAEVFMLRAFDNQRDTMDVPDPYYGGVEGFQLVFDIVERSCKELLRYLEQKD